jgi:hypothetical protein
VGIYELGDFNATLATHQVPIGEFDGPHRLFGPDGKLLQLYSLSRSIARARGPFIK